MTLAVVNHVNQEECHLLRDTDDRVRLVVGLRFPSRKKGDRASGNLQQADAPRPRRTRACTPPAIAHPAITAAMNLSDIYEQLLALEREGAAWVLVVLVEALGSTPQDTGAKMLVTAGGLHSGTVGGGIVEAKAIACARELLARGKTAAHFVNWTLKTDVGMTCGGSVKLYFEPHPAGGAGAAWPIWIFGAGHVVPAGARAARLPAHDRRSAPRVARPSAARPQFGTTTRLNSDDARQRFSLPHQGHATDRPVLPAPAGRNFPYLGVIGSDAKAAVLRREPIVPACLPDAPGGSTVRRSRFRHESPHEIALSVAAQLLTERDKLRG